jgi:ABC-type Fe3+/spermidine/putrescine transport system ATPase subunit
MTSLSLTDISKRFNETPVLNSVSVNIEDGEFFSLLGPSGCGKSTLLRIIAGLESPDTGSIYLGTTCLDALPPQKRGIGLVFQNYALWPHMTIKDNIMFGLKAQRVSPAERSNRLKHVLELVQLAHLQSRFPHELSGGQQQRVALARALAIRPSVILLDEPLSNLDSQLRLDIRNELSVLHRELGTTTVYVTHDQDDALSLSDRIALLNGGSIAQLGTPKDLYEKPTSLFAATFLGKSNIIPVHILKTLPDNCLSVSLSGQPEMAVHVPSYIEVRQDMIGSHGTVSIRPEKVKIISSASSSSCAFPATVQHKQYRGFYQVIEFRIPGGQVIQQITTNSMDTSDVLVGSSVSIGWEYADAVFIPQTEGR